MPKAYSADMRGRVIAEVEAELRGARQPRVSDQCPRKKGGTGLGLASPSGLSRCMADAFGWSPRLVRDRPLHSRFRSAWRAGECASVSGFWWLKIKRTTYKFCAIF
jgi:hypothetical protein